MSDENVRFGKKLEIDRLKRRAERISALYGYIAFFIIAICLITVVAQSISGKKASLFGYRYYVVLTDSMSPTLLPDDVILSKAIDGEEEAMTLKVGDVVTFVARYGYQKGMTITHRVTRAPYLDEESGAYCIGTKGDKEGATEDPKVPLSSVEGVMVMNTSFIKGLYGFFSTSLGLIILMVVPMVVILGALIYRLVIVIKSPIRPTKTAEEQLDDRIAELKKKAVEEYLRQKEKDGE